MTRVLENDLLKEKVYMRRVEPGLEVFVLPKQGYNKKYATFSTNFGSIDSRFIVEGEGKELSVPDGVAHFLEHKLFEDEEGNVFDRFAKLGASSNAFTNFTNTAYLFSTTQHFEECFELLLDFVQSPYFTEESVEKEKGIIEQEIRMYEDNAQWRLFFNLLTALYREHPVRIDIAGTVESIHQIDKEVLYKCYRTFYHPSNMAVFVVGDVEPERILDQVEANINKHNYKPLGEIHRIYPDEPRELAKDYVAQELVVSEPVLNIGFKERDLGYDGPELFKRELITGLVLDVVLGSSSKLYNELYEEGLIDDEFDAGHVAEKKYGHTVIGGETSDPDRLFARLQEGIRDAQRQGISTDKFEHHRRKLMGEFLKSFNSLEFIANNFLAYHFKNINFFDYLDILQGITVEDANRRLAEHFAEDNLARSLILPKKS
ncbi:EF-P 5-aminopentanol modification-associated protein YfmH [Dethiobacter alkaliphilus]|uniref:Peptidase M16 domain protein n=1 Tax=Dethiobacter alkaliphilus AHT 1 TaxID=555088 RepID=C0GH49_DETAL|nr:pitrilysin family protein [Dethiobacter alkaliphilus]EEG77351.1 peptidase M16 domain protein [Dethiobacter alkaliphilus AHT 1]